MLTVHELERAICCPAGRCSSPGDCYAEDRSRSYPGASATRRGGSVAVGGKAEAAACRAAMLARPVGGVGDDKPRGSP